MNNVLKTLKALSGISFLLAFALTSTLFFNHDAFAQISRDEAKNIALKHAKVNANQVTFEKLELDRDKKGDTYEIEFYTNDTEYEYEINAQNGKIVDFSQEKRNTRNSQSNQHGNQNQHNNKR